MQDLHTPFRDDALWPRERIWQVTTAAATADCRWEGRCIIGWSEWTGAYGKKQTIMALDDGTRSVIHEVGVTL